MVTSEPLHFFDIDSNISGPLMSWSPNIFKTRMVLNLKGIPYTQSWTSLVDIASLMKHLGVPPNQTGTPYTLPAICHKSVNSNPHGVMMDSLPIAMHLEECYPSPSLFPSGDVSYALTVAVGKIMGGMAPALRKLMPPKVPDCLDARGREYFIRTRSEYFGKPLSEVRPTDEKSLRELYALIESQMSAIIQMLRGRPGKTGPFFEGNEPSYADIILVSAFASLHIIDHELWERIMALGEGELKAQYDACLPWIEGQGEKKEWPIPQRITSNCSVHCEPNSSIDIHIIAEIYNDGAIHGGCNKLIYAIKEKAGLKGLPGSPPMVRLLDPVW